MTLVRWDPFRELTNFEDRWSGLFRGISPRRSEETLAELRRLDSTRGHL